MRKIPKSILLSHWLEAKGKKKNAGNGLKNAVSKH